MGDGLLQVPAHACGDAIRSRPACPAASRTPRPAGRTPRKGLRRGIVPGVGRHAHHARAAAGPARQRRRPPGRGRRGVGSPAARDDDRVEGHLQQDLQGPVVRTPLPGPGRRRARGGRPTRRHRPTGRRWPALFRCSCPIMCQRRPGARASVAAAWPSPPGRGSPRRRHAEAGQDLDIATPGTSWSPRRAPPRRCVRLRARARVDARAGRPPARRAARATRSVVLSSVITRPSSQGRGGRPRPPADR